MTASVRRAAAPTSSVLELLRRRSSVRNFTGERLEPHVLDALLDTALRAPTSFNFQSYSLVTLVDEGRRKELAEILGKDFVRQCAAFVLVCCDLAALPEKGDNYGVPLGEWSADAALSATIDASMVGMCLSLAADSLGLGTVMIGAVRRSPDRVAEVFALPPGVTPLFGVCIGWAATTPAARPRLRSDLMVHRERYRQTGSERAALPSDAILRNPAGPVTEQDLHEWRAQVVKGLRTFRGPG
ncbi:MULTISPECIES: nitroreductase family protein [unclassified Streptomyces]|uniref:nitroreductase family protein n=1 Tax=unclassified Streptomyces TaxID=2593676 RepID=UPI000A785AC3|nr:nitroreductase family protein [Streptomyces sp. NBRC 110028]